MPPFLVTFCFLKKRLISPLISPRQLRQFFFFFFVSNDVQKVMETVAALSWFHPLLSDKHFVRPATLESVAFIQLSKWPADASKCFCALAGKQAVGLISIHLVKDPNCHFNKPTSCSSDPYWMRLSSPCKQGRRCPIKFDYLDIKIFIKQPKHWINYFTHSPTLLD